MANYLNGTYLRSLRHESIFFLTIVFIYLLILKLENSLVARVLHLIYRLVVQPNTSRAHTFADAFISSGGIETLLVLLQREVKAGDRSVPESPIKNAESPPVQESELDSFCGVSEVNQGDNEASLEEKERVSYEIDCEPESIKSFPKEPGWYKFSISADNARNNVYNVDKSDGIVVGIIGLLGALVSSGHLKFGSSTPADMTSNIVVNELHEGGGTMFNDKISLLLFALQKAFQAAPNRLMTSNVYTALLGASINASATDDGLNFMILVIALSIYSFCCHPENRSSLTKMEEWPEWILEVLISNYEMGSNKDSTSANFGDIEDLIHNFLIIILEHSMRQKDGWKDIEATIHCAEWLSMVGGSSTGDQRIRGNNVPQACIANISHTY
ncbi:hypothetical protein AAG906_009857 [Vitis piasezkii]